MFLAYKTPLMNKAYFANCAPNQKPGWEKKWCIYIKITFFVLNHPLTLI